MANKDVHDRKRKKVTKKNKVSKRSMFPKMDLYNVGGWRAKKISTAM